MATTALDDERADTVQGGAEPGDLEISRLMRCLSLGRRLVTTGGANRGDERDTIVLLWIVMRCFGLSLIRPLLRHDLCETTGDQVWAQGRRPEATDM